MKTKATDSSVERFIDAIEDAGQREDCKTLTDMMQRVTGASPKMWGDAIVGFGDFRYRYESGREGDWFLTGFSPRKGKISIYTMTGFDRYPDLMERLGKYKVGKSCLYIRRLDDVDLGVLEELAGRSVKETAERYST